MYLKYFKSFEINFYNFTLKLATVQSYLSANLIPEKPINLRLLDNFELVLFDRNVFCSLRKVL